MRMRSGSLFGAFLEGHNLGCSRECLTEEVKKGRFCNTIASVALVHNSVQSDYRMQTKEILSSRNSKQTKPQSCPETSTANSRLVRVKGGFKRRHVLITKEEG